MTAVEASESVFNRVVVIGASKLVISVESSHRASSCRALRKKSVSSSVSPKSRKSKLGER